MIKKISTEGAGEASVAQQIDAKIKALDDWRGQTLARIRVLVH